ncbi:MAG: hypothetical protein ABI488_12010 [Polyangiaceae bacterium]
MTLGRRVSLHRGSFAAGGWSWYLAGICLVAGVLGLVHGVAGDSQQLVTGALALGVGIVLLIMPVLRWKQSVEVFERGFVWTRLSGTVQVAREEIRNVTLITHRSRQGTRVEVKVDLTNGKTRSIVGVQQPEQLANLLRAAPSSSPQDFAPNTVVAGAPGSPQQGWAPGGWKPPGT